MNSSRKVPWVSGLILAAIGALALIARVGFGLVNILGELLSTPPPM
jgi:hypothetical protein